MLSSTKSTGTLSLFLANLQQAFQDWVRRVIIDDDPYDALTVQDLTEENVSNASAVESAELV
jgi:hypothetical protein